jgi:hypothetical protein
MDNNTLVTGDLFVRLSIHQSQRNLSLHYFIQIFCSELW